mmetsp:Transcript_13207/g.40606  ORF Transcript_13207/g.40606 Transcript_13207/m.40606 type:complete len:429 (+) Transcript_13207:81-1367(+)
MSSGDKDDGKAGENSKGSGAEFAKVADELRKALISSNASERPTEHRFWNTQPVLQADLQNEQDQGPIDRIKTVDEIQKEPYQLLSQFVWCECDVTDDKEVNEIYTFLNENYVEDEDAMFRFDYSRDFLKWALMPPGWRRDWHVGVRVKTSGKLVGFITAIPARIVVHDRPLEVVEINFLCIHKKLRSKRLAPVMIKEITRRVNLQGIFQAVYTAGVVLPRPVSQCRYYHRSLNPKKLIKVGFSRLAPRMTMMRTIRLYTLAEQPATPGLRKMEKGDIDAVHKLLAAYHKKHLLRINFTKEDIEHWICPVDKVVYSYVVEKPGTKEITDFCSFYLLPSSIIRNEEYSTLYAAYLFYYATTSTPLLKLLEDLMILARNNSCDVFNALDVMDNASVFKDLKFHIGDGQLNYYLFNWKCPRIDPSENGLVML